MSAGKVGKPTRDSSKGSVHLGPGLFDQHCPDFLSLSSAESGLSGASHNREVVVDVNGGRSTVDEKGNLVNTCSVDLLGLDEASDSVRELGEGTEDGQEVTVTKLALVDVVRLNFVREKHYVVKYFTCSLPLIRIEVGAFRRVDKHIDLGVVKTLCFRGEVRVGPWLSLINNTLHKIRSLRLFADPGVIELLVFLFAVIRCITHDCDRFASLWKDDLDLSVLL